MLFRKRIMRSAVFIVLMLIQVASSAQVTADFSSSITSGCSPLIVQFTDLSTGPVTSWSWNFGNGNISTQKNPGAIYITPGCFNVRLIVSDGVVTDTMIKTCHIRVFQNPSPALTADVAVGCAPHSVNFTDNSTPGSAPIATWIWDFSDGSTSTLQHPSHNYVNPGNYNVTISLIDTNGCMANRTYNALIQVGTVPSANFGSDVNSACFPPLTVNFADSSAPASGLNYFWEFGDGNSSTSQNPSNTYLGLGTYNVKLKVTTAQGCEDSITVNTYVAIEDLVADFTADFTQGCVGQPIQFTDISTSNPNSWQWDFGDGDTSAAMNPTHVYATPGTYSVSLIAANSGSCSDTVQKVSYIQISTSPVAAFTSDIQQSCSAPLNVNFTNSSSNAVSWLWDFGDGNTSTLEHPSHTYLVADTFTVTLTATTVDGCAATATLNDYILIAPPQVMFDAEGRYGCTPREVEFGDSSMSADPIVSWLWDFGDGDTSTQQHPVHQYTITGDYHVTLTVTNSSGCSALLTDSNFVGVGDTPSVAFTATPLIVCNYEPVAFINNTINSNSWYWEFGDGGQAFEFEPTYTYADTGYFDVKLVARNNGCPDSLILEDYIYVSPPDAIFTEAYNCGNPYSVNFIDGSLAPDTWSWDFGDGATDSIPSPTHVFAARGTYQVSLTCTSFASGCVDVEEHAVLITDPVADFIAAPTYGCRPLIVNFSDNSIDALAWSWESGGMTSTSQNPTFTYTETGVYDVRLIVTDIHGCTDTILKANYITVTGPTADFTSVPTAGCAPLGTAFVDSSVIYSSPITSWSWDFGDGNFSSLQNPSHVFTQTGFFNVSLTVTDADGCQHAAAKPNFIQPTFPIPDFSCDTLTCTTLGIQFINMAVGIGMTFLWDFGDSSTSTATNPHHYYTNEGIYTVSFTVTDANGCDTTLVRPNLVEVSNPQANFVADDTFAPCPPLLVNFADSSTDAVSWNWSFGNGSTSTLQEPSHVYIAPGSYDVSLIVQSAMGCRDTLVREDYIVVSGPTGTFSFTPDSGCLGQQVDFSAVTINTASRTWDFGDGTVQGGGDSIHYSYPTIGVFHPIMILDDGLGCIHAVPSPDSIVVGNVAANFNTAISDPCLLQPMQFNNLTSAFPAVISRIWDFGDGNTSTALNPSHSYDTSGNFDVTLIEFNGICHDTMTRVQYITVTPYPQADFAMSSASACASIEINFTDSTATDTVLTSWLWNFRDGGVDSVPNPAHTFTSAGTYDIELIVESAKGCSDTVSKSLAVYSLPVASAGPDTTECSGTPVQLNGTGGSSYSWYPPTGLDDPNVANPIATPSDSIIYVLTVTDTHNCQSIDSMTFNVLATPVAASIGDVEICSGDSVQIWTSGSTNYQWSPGVTLTCDTCAATTAFPATTTLYVVNVSNAYQCYDMDSVQVTVRERPGGIITSDREICAGEQVQLESDSGTIHTWSPDTALSCASCSNPVATPDTTTVYTLEIINQFNCESHDSITITVHPLPVISIQAENICDGDTGQIISSGGAIYNWTPSSGLSCDNCPNPNTSPDSTTTYHLEVLSSFACASYDSVTIEVLPDPTVQTIEDVTICRGDDVTLTTFYTTTDSFNWTPLVGIKNIANPIATPDSTTTYAVTAINFAGCEETDQVTVTVISKVDAVAAGDLEICIGESAQLEAIINGAGHHGATVAWYPVNYLDNPNSLTPTATPQHTTTYTMVAFSGSCEPDTSTITVEVNLLPVVHLGGPFDVLENEQLELSPTGSDNIAAYNWDFNSALSCLDCRNPNVYVTAPEEFRLTVTDDNDCSASASTRVFVKGFCEDNIFVPKAFSPNYDEVNDLLYVRSLHIADLKYFRVFDRWGNKVFETSDQEVGWDGIYRNKRMNPGVFVYGLDAVCTNGKRVQMKGNVTLIR